MLIDNATNNIYIDHTNFRLIIKHIYQDKVISKIKKISNILVYFYDL